jgi:HlyD family secretion protein
MKKIIAILVVLAAVCAGAGYWYVHAHRNSQTVFHFDEVRRGRIIATVGSTGTVQARELVDVGAQVAGRIISLGKDPNTQSGIVEWGSQVQGPVLDKDGNMVKPGTLLAQIDPAIYQAQVSSATAAVKSAQADLQLKTAQLNQATADWERAQKLYATGGIAQAEYDQSKATFGVATANVEVSKAQIGVAQSNLKTAQTNLDYCTISSPVNGTVIDRRVNVGQTVVASLSAPSLFLIAKDLTKMEVWATVNEVDIGRIQVGQDVTFTVDALPGRTYKGKVVPQGKLPTRLNAQMVSNVVTYYVVVSVDNSDMRLKPYMTANLSFVVADKKNVLLVPNAALRWQPATAQIAPDERQAYAKLTGKKRAPSDSDASDHGFLWVQGDDGYVRYIEVRTGVSDLVNTEIVGVLNGGELPEHTKVITGEGRAQSASGGANPFAPQMFRPKAKE